MTPPRSSRGPIMDISDAYVTANLDSHQDHHQVEEDSALAQRSSYVWHLGAQHGVTFPFPFQLRWQPKRDAVWIRLSHATSGLCRRRLMSLDTCFPTEPSSARFGLDIASGVWTCDSRLACRSLSNLIFAFCVRWKQVGKYGEACA
jgi:hypothetical protein